MIYNNEYSLAFSCTFLQFWKVIFPKFWCVAFYKVTSLNYRYMQNLLLESKLPLGGRFWFTKTLTLLLVRLFSETMLSQEFHRYMHNLLLESKLPLSGRFWFTKTLTLLLVRSFFRNNVITRISWRARNCFNSSKVFLKSMFHSHACIDIVHLHLIQSWVLSKKNSQDCIFHLVFPSPLPFAVLSWSCLVLLAFWLAVWVEASAFAHLSVLVDGVDQHLSFGPCRRDNWVPQPHFSSFWLEDCSLVLCSSLGGGFAIVASSFLPSVAK